VTEGSAEAASAGIGLRASGARIVEVYDNRFSGLPHAAVRLAEDGTISERAVVLRNRVDAAATDRRLVRGSHPIGRLFTDW
jgi:hypothetical protein